MTIGTNPTSDTAEQAGWWDARLRAPDCTDEDRQSFAAWRDADPAHREAFERLQTIVATLRHDRGRADIRALRDEALRTVQRRKRRLWATAAVAAGFILCIVGLVLWNIPRSDIYSTGTGQRSAFVLEDGSIVELNSQSRIDVRFSKQQRRIELAQGQAWFSVAKNPNRPFVVVAGNRQIVALGTQFDVRLDAGSLQVTLVEGKVRVEAAPDNAIEDNAIELTPGRQFVTEPEPRVRDIDVSKVTGWREGRIFLDDVLLAEAVREMNKHSAVQIRIDAPALEDLRVNGMFKAGGQDSFVAALQEYFPISAHRGVHEIVLTTRPQ